VAEVDDLLVEQACEAAQRAAVGVEEELREHRHLRRPIPAVRAVDEHGDAPLVEGERAAVRAAQERGEVLPAG
jgi:hypothetical protein